MVNAKVLQESLTKIKFDMANGGEVFKHIFTASPELRKFYDVEDIDPDAVPHSKKIQQRGASLLSSLKTVVGYLDDEKNLKLELKEVASSFKEMGMKSEDIKKFAPGMISFLDEKAGKLNDAQRKEWKAFYEKYDVLLKQNGLV